MAKPNQNQPVEQYSVSEDAARLREERKTAMQEAALRSSETATPQVSPPSTPLKKDSNSWENKNGNLSEPVRDQLNVPQEQGQTSSKANLQDVHTIGQSLKKQGVSTNEVSQANSRTQIENSFDTNGATGSSVTQAKPVSETDKVTLQARQSAQRDNSQSQSLEWER